ncbi:MAG: ABC transporter ATP-binding protein [Brachybacterium sp.]|uniref:ATP-binding cassette domain-containing protein n=1 Tax=Brachybacterium sp. TaxID=1891286 RepID=UPI002648D863|nr:ABC transporter ATP-binding protein [Brachybacterium sp.]MDN5686717.1 ABC transporter ATP-binding protein [Brachybacterium sp.]
MSTTPPEPHGGLDPLALGADETPSDAVRGEELTVELPSLGRPYAAPLRAVHELSLSVPTGQVTALVGRNGAGKTTTLRTLIGALPFSAGCLEVLGTEMGPAHVAMPSGVAVVPDAPAYPPRWTARQVARAHGATAARFDHARFDAYLSEHRVPVDRPVNAFSRGQLTQLAVAAALAQDPRLLILDEPFARLDPLARAELVDELRDLMVFGDRTILLSTHDLEGMDRFVDHLVVLAQGRAALEGDVETLREEFLVLEQAGSGNRSDDAHGLESLIGPVTTGETTRGLVHLDEAAGLVPGAHLRRPGMNELVTHWLRAASSPDRASSTASTSRRGTA